MSRWRANDLALGDEKSVVLRTVGGELGHGHGHRKSGLDTAAMWSQPLTGRTHDCCRLTLLHTALSKGVKGRTSWSLAIMMRLLKI